MPTDARNPNPPRDSLELRSHRDGSRRKIPWDALDPEILSPAQRKIVGSAWLARARTEHLAVGTFALLTTELASEGCDSITLSMITRAANDEVRHADLCRRLAACWLGDAAVPVRFHGMPRIPMHPTLPSREQTLLHVVEMCCLNETFTGAYFTAMLERTTHVTSREVLESLLEDEIDHGRVGWGYLAVCVRDGWGAAVVQKALPTLLERTAGRVIDAASSNTPADDVALEAHAYLGVHASAAVYREALTHITLPGFAAAGVDATEARSLCAARGWSEPVTAR